MECDIYMVQEIQKLKTPIPIEQKPLEQELSGDTRAESSGKHR